MVQFQHVSKIYDNKISAVSDINFKVEEGEFVFLIGPSGSGKTTIIKMLIRDEVPSDGKIYFNDQDITRINRKKVYKLRREIGVIFQDFKLVQDKTSFENVAFAMEAAGKKDKEIRETVPYVLDIVGLSNRMKAFPRQLSGGEQQRVAIARAIANNPKILIADEPTGNLDPASAWDIVQILSKINNWGTTLIMSTHGTDIVNSLNKRVIQMDGGRVTRDDNKGQYEMTGNFETSVVENAEKEIPKKITKKKSTFSTKILLETNPEDHPIDEDVPKKKRGLFSKLFRRNKQEESEDIKKTPAEENTEDAEPVVEVKEEKPKKVKKTKQDDKIVAMDKTNETIEEKEKQDDSKDKDEDVPVEKNEKDDKKLLHINLSTGLARNIADTVEKPLEEKDSNIKIDIKKAKEIVHTDEKTPISELDLTKKITKSLKNAGFNYVEEIIEKGPEGLSESLEIDPEEIVLISREIKKFIELKK